MDSLHVERPITHLHARVSVCVGPRGQVPVPLDAISPHSRDCFLLNDDTVLPKG